MLFSFNSFSVDMADAAIRHENGKQVARWNVDPNYSGPETPTSSLGYALSAGHHPFLSNHVPHPNSISANRTQAYTTGQLTRHPNGKLLFSVVAVVTVTVLACKFLSSRLSFFLV
jgi:hypothetical protein